MQGHSPLWDSDWETELSFGPLAGFRPTQLVVVASGQLMHFSPATDGGKSNSVAATENGKHEEGLREQCVEGCDSSSTPNCQRHGTVCSSSMESSSCQAHFSVTIDLL